MTNSADPDQLASLEANWSGSTQFAKTGHVIFSKRRVKSVCFSNTKASRWMKLHTHILHDAPWPLPSSITDLDLLFILGWIIFSLYLDLCLLKTTSKFLVMSTHSVFLWRNKENIGTFHTLCLRENTRQEVLVYWKTAQTIKLIIRLHITWLQMCNFYL